MRSILVSLLLLLLSPAISNAQIGKRWYSYTDLVYNNALAAGNTEYITAYSLWNDTAYKVGYMSGSTPTYFVGKTRSVGMSFAPRLAGWDDVGLYGSTIKVGNTDVYTIDSVRLTGIYLRNNLRPAIKDTLRIAFVYGDGSGTSNIIERSTTSPHYGTIDFPDMLHDTVKNIAGKNPSATATPYVQSIILSNTDTASYFVRSIVLSTPFTVPAGKIASMSLTFKSGDNTYTLGDTIRYASGAYKYGMFSPYVGYNATVGDDELWPIYDPVDSNVGFFQITSGSGWSGYYIPTFAWSSSSTVTGASSAQYPAIDYHINCPTCRLNDTIAGNRNICVGSTRTFTHSVTGGTWSSSATGVATIVSSSGLLTAIAAGTATITYNVSGHLATAVVTVSPVPNAGTMTGPSSVCTGSFISLTDVAPGGIWSTSSSAIAPLAGGSGSSMNIAGGATGTATISYTVANGCATAVATHTVTVVSMLSAGTISGPGAVCVGATITLSDPVTGGTWSNTTGNATVTSSGVVTGVSIGSEIIHYMVSNACGSVVANATVSVGPAIDPGTITSPAGICVGASTPISSSTTSGTWSTAAGNASVTGSSDLNGVSVGTDVITYLVTTSCGSAYTTAPVTVNPLPTPVIAVSGATLSTTIPYASYQWLYGGTPIGGATNATYDVTLNGAYSVSVVDANGCTGASGVTIVSNVGVNDIVAANAGLLISPNPASGHITITSPAPIHDIIITNMVGQTVFSSGHSNTSSVVISLAQLPSGVYGVRVNDSKMYKIIKR